MSQDQKVRLADEIYAQQPNMLASILAPPSMGVDMAQLEVALHILLVTFQAMKLSGQKWPLVTEDIQDGCLQRLTARARFNEGRGQLVQVNPPFARASTRVLRLAQERVSPRRACGNPQSFLPRIARPARHRWIV